MSKDDVDVRVRLREARKAQQDAQKTGRSFLGMGRSAKRAGVLASASSKGFRLSARAMLGVGGAAGTAAAGVGFLAYKVGKESVVGYQEHMAVARQTKAVIKSTGGAANVSAKDIGSLSDSLERKTTMDGDAIQSGANMLATFTNVRNGVGKADKIFDRATGTLVDMAAAMGTDPKKAAIQLGKALNDPIKGVSALSKVGVTFTEDQKAQIKALVESGDAMSAQKMILKELNKEFGGSGKAMSTPARQLEVTWHSIQDSIGAGLLPLVDTASNAINDLATDAAPHIEKASKDIRKIFEGSGSTEDKIKLAFAVGKQDLKPITDEIGGMVKDAHVDKLLQDAFVSASPRVADALAAAAPRAAGAFLQAFQHAGPGGQLITVALLAAKLGAFRGVGSILASRTAGAFASNLPDKIGKRNIDAEKAARKQRGFARAFGTALGAVGAYFMLKEIAAGMPELNQYSGKKGWKELAEDIADYGRVFAGGKEHENKRKPMPSVGPDAKHQTHVTTEQVIAGGPIKTSTPKGSLGGYPHLTENPPTSRSMQGTPTSGPVSTQRSTRGRLALTADAPVILKLNDNVLAEGVAKVSVKRRERGR